MRHGLRRLSRHAAGRRDRVLPGRAGQAHALTILSCPRRRASRRQRSSLLHRSFGGYWIPAFAGMTLRSNIRMSNRDKRREPVGKPPSQRQLKVGEMIRHALAEIFARGEIMDEVLNRHSLTVPEVRMSPDLKLATVYVMTLGGGEVQEAVDHLEKHKRFLRGILAKRVNMKFMPELRFKVDTSFEAASRIDELLARPEVARDLDD